MDIFTQKGKARRANKTNTLTDTTRAILHDTLDRCSTEEVVDTISRVNLQLDALKSIAASAHSARAKRVRYLMAVRAILVDDLHRRAK